MSTVTGVDKCILAFDVPKNTLAIASGDGRVRVFGAAQSRLLVDATAALRGNHMRDRPGSDVYRCMAWGSHSASEEKRMLFLGTTDGRVKCYDVAQANVRWVASSTVEGPVVAVSASSAVLLVAGTTGGLALLNIDEGSVLARNRTSKQSQTRCALLAEGDRALVAGASIGLYDLVSGARLYRWTGHSNPVIALKVVSDIYFCSAAEGERIVSIWSLNLTESGKLRHKSAVAHLTLDGPVADDGVSVGQASSGRFFVAVVSESGLLKVFRCFEDAKGETLTVSSFGVSVGGKVLAAYVERADESGVNLTIVAGNTARPLLLKKRIEQMKTDEAAQISIPHDSAGLLLAKEQDTIVADGVGPTGTSIGTEQGTLLRKKSKRPLNDDNSVSEAVNNKEDEINMVHEGSEEDADDDMKELTFAERIAALRDAADAGPIGGNFQDQPVRMQEEPLKADSLAVLLNQALQSSDRELLERCLAVRSENVISKTVGRLNPKDVVAFLNAAVERLQSTPSRGEALVSWIRAVLMHHAAYLVGVGGANETLGWLYQIIESRLANYQTLLGIQGRLQLVMSSAKRSNVEENNDEVSTLGPLVTLHIGDDEVDVEDAFGRAGDDGDHDAELHDSEQSDTDIDGDDISPFEDDLETT